MTRRTKEPNRPFSLGERVKVAKRSVVVDRERSQEGIPNDDDKVPIEQDMTGQEGEVTAPPYYSDHRGEVMLPIKLPNEAVISVPEDRVERASRTPRRDEVEPGVGGVPSRETLEFWRRHFEAQDRKRKKR